MVHMVHMIHTDVNISTFPEWCHSGVFFFFVNKYSIWSVLSRKNQKCGVFCKNIGQILLRITRPSILTIWIWPLSLDGMGSLNHVPTRALLRMSCADKVKEKGCLSICYIYIAKNDKTWTRPRRIGCQVQAAAWAWAPLSGRGSRCWGLGCRSWR